MAEIQKRTNLPSSVMLRLWVYAYDKFSEDSLLVNKSTTSIKNSISRSHRIVREGRISLSSKVVEVKKVIC